MKKFILFIFSVTCSLLHTSCSRSNNDTPTLATTIQSDINIYLRDSSGTNLLESSKDYSTPAIFYDDPVPPPSAGVGTVNFIILTDAKGEKFIRIFLNMGLKSSTVTNTKVQWNPNQTDNFRTEFIKASNYVVANKVYLNGQLIMASQGENYVTITK